MPTIVPAILEQSKEGFLDKISQVMKIPGIDRIQVDFCDGIFVPNSTVAVAEITTLKPAFNWEAHLMTQLPHDFLDYQIAGFQTIIFHYEAFKSETELEACLTQLHAQNLHAELCINPETPVEVLKKYENKVKHFQLMGVKPGYQGSHFIEETYQRIAELRKLCPNAILEVDGGIHETNIKKVADAGADCIVIGSALIQAPDMLLAYEKLQIEMIRNA